MSLAVRVRERFRVRLARFIEKERGRGGSARKVMKDASRAIGLSALSLYRVLNGTRPVKIEAHHYAALLMHSLGIVRMAEKIRARRHRAAMHA